MAELFFWTSAAWVLWTYAGYPIAIRMIGIVRRKRIVEGESTPSLTVVIAAYNEVEHIAATVRNKLGQDYPADRVRIIVVSDASDDGTDEAVQGIADSRVVLLRQESRQGKTAALNRAVELADSDLIVFSDANSHYEQGTLRALAAVFEDPSVGYATGKMIYGNPDGSVVGDGCTGFMRYENWLREQETLSGSIVGVDGGVDAVRRGLYEPMRPDQLPDFVLPLSVVAAGYRVVYQPAAVLKENALSDSGHEFRMRVRVSLRAFWALWDMRKLFNPLRYPMFSVQLLSHKALRYLAFVPLLALLILSVVLYDAALIYKIALFAQAAFWLLAGLACLTEFGRLTGWPYYFAILNVAAAVAFFRFIRGEKQIIWRPRGGT